MAWPNTAPRSDGESTPGSNRPLLYWVHDGLGKVVPYLGLSKAVGHVFETEGLTPVKAAGIASIHATIPGMADAYTQKIQESSPDREVWVGGLCAGGVIAYEIVRNLEQQGRKVGGLVLLDAACPTAVTPIHFEWKQRARRFAYGFSEARRSEGKTAGLWTKTVLRKLGRWVRHELEVRSVDRLQALRLRMFHRAMEKGRRSDLPPFLQNIGMQSLYERAERRHRPSGPITSPIHLVRATEGEGEDTPMKDRVREKAFGWDQVSAGPIHLYDAPGGHSTMLQRPHVDAVAELLETAAQASAWPQT